LAFGVAIDKDVVRRILSVHYRPESDSGGPSWLTFLGHMKDSLWSPWRPALLLVSDRRSGGDRNQDGALWPSYSTSNIIIMSIERTLPAGALSRLIPNADCCLSLVIRHRPGKGIDS
jgi:hypothetical protein